MIITKENLKDREKEYNINNFLQNIKIPTNLFSKYFWKNWFEIREEENKKWLKDNKL